MIRNATYFAFSKHVKISGMTDFKWYNSGMATYAHKHTFSVALNLIRPPSFGVRPSAIDPSVAKEFPSNTIWTMRTLTVKST